MVPCYTVIIDEKNSLKLTEKKSERLRISSSAMTEEKISSINSIDVWLYE
jgi:hypothetical protein